MYHVITRNIVQKRRFIGDYRNVLFLLNAVLCIILYYIFTSDQKLGSYPLTYT